MSQKGKNSQAARKFYKISGTPKATAAAKAQVKNWAQEIPAHRWLQWESLEITDHAYFTPRQAEWTQAQLARLEIKISLEEQNVS